MAYLIDTDIVFDHLADLPEATELLSTLAVDGLAISVSTYMEAFQGVLRGTNRQDAQEMFDAFIDGVPVLVFSEPVARPCASLRETLRLHGRRVRARALDLMIAATALEYSLTLVTRNLHDYADIPGLQLYRD